MAKKNSKTKKKIVSPKKKVSKKSKVAKVVLPKARKLNRYNEIQKYLSSYARETGVKFGKDFTKIASQINQHTQGKPLKYVEQNIGEIYKEHFEKAKIKSEFEESFPFYNFESVLMSPMFDNMLISYSMDDGFEQFEISGETMEVIEYFKSGTYRYLRTYYNDSPVAIFKLEDTDNKTFVKYVVDVSASSRAESTGDTKITPPVDDKATGGAKGDTASLIALEQEKQKTSQEQRKTMEMALELIKAGFTKEEVIKLIGK